jgi:hypothetical protein
MAKVKGPLMSMEASGTIGNTITFDKRGFVRNRVIPTNPQSDSQGNTRQKLLAVQKALRFIGAAVIAAVKTIAPTSYRWNSYLLSQVIGAATADFDASMTAFAALGSTAIGHWDTTAEGIGITSQSITYATDAAISPGAALFAIARTLYRLGFNTSAGAPGATNYAAWGTYFTS